jgi:multidrug efflux pump subunit AcrB
MKLLRRLHLFLGCFFAPLLLFYVATGWYQTVTVRRNKLPGEAEDWVGRLRSVHVDQIYPSDSANAYSPLLFRIFVVAMALALIVTVILGIVLAFRSIRQRWLVWLSLGLGIALPLLCLWLGQRR